MADMLRPDPDRLLQQTRERPRGKLKIFFGACAGVGKTWAMLQEARRLHARQLDVLIGVVETHGRQETAALLQGLPRLPPQQRQHRGRQVEEFDLDAALARHPAVILIDELAHSNAPGSRHPKRWQDVKELLAAGIDVLTTVNVQHLESLNDVVNGVTGIQVRETLPDPFFDAADEIILVDLPPDDLLLRLKQGKVYTGDRADRAAEHFFRKGNLIALRELALRRTADRVDNQMQAWRDGRGRDKVWHTRDAVLLCVGYDEGSEKLVRTAARLAARLGSEWHAVCVETPGWLRLTQQQRRTALASLRLARQLGAESAVLADASADKAIARYARDHDLGKVVLGRGRGRHLFRSSSLADRLAARAPELDLVIVAPGDRPAAAAPPQRQARRWRQGIRGCLLATALCALITFIASHWLLAFDPANLVMLYLLGVVVVALQAGRWPSVFATIINVVSFDLFFVAPRGTLAVSDAQYLLTFGVMLSVGLLVGNLTAGVRYQARIARYRERRTGQLYALSSTLAKARSAQEVAAASQHAVYTIFHADSALLLPDENDRLVRQLPAPNVMSWDEGIARWSFVQGEPAGAGTDTLPGVPYQILPLRAAEKSLGVMVIAQQTPPALPEQQQLLETVLLLTASALERLQLTASEEQARVIGEREQLRHSLLAALSHDLRTPLTVLFGQVEILTLDLASARLPQARQASEIRQHVLRLTRLVNNLLDMARLQTGGFHLKREWLTLEEVIGSALATLDPGGRQPVTLEMADPLALVHVDGPLFERVLINLLENAMKYAGAAAQIGIRAQTRPGELTIEVWDSGPGLPAGQEQALFAKFTRGDRESAIPGVGLGLAICQAIVEVHNGVITAHQRPQGGASFRISLPQAPLPDIAETGEAL
ncbi:two-component system sensor histidine kinase KdpD [Erwinia sp. ACCC 02193]|jgi:two-component system sensor histidine kinase KdpD|uniref:histidine kinase n=1 Tax=Erwinia aeris TaxID=3239803 RepID=A0ABV4E364_9GAMM